MTGDSAPYSLPHPAGRLLSAEQAPHRLGRPETGRAGGGANVFLAGRPADHAARSCPSRSRCSHIVDVDHEQRELAHHRTLADLGGTLPAARRKHRRLPRPGGDDHGRPTAFWSLRGRNFPARLEPVTCVHGSRQTRPDRPAGLQAVPGDDDVRTAIRREHRGRHPRPGRRGRHRLPRHLGRLSPGRGPEHQGNHRGDPRPLAQGQAGPLHRGHEVLRPHRPGAVRRRQLPQAHPRRRRRLAAAAADRLHRPVPAARIRPGDTDRRDPRRPGRPRPRRARSATSAARTS